MTRTQWGTKYKGDTELKVSVAQGDVGDALLVQHVEVVSPRAWHRRGREKILIIVESVLASRGELGKKAHGDLSKVTSGLVVHGSGGFLT